MILSEYFNSKKTNKLIGFNSKFDFFKNLIEKNELPKVTMLSGDKGIGKSTFINHLTHFYFDKKNYNIDEKSFKDNKFHKQFLNNILQDVCYLSGSDNENVKIDQVRKLKIFLFKKPILFNKRFIILDDVEKFNINSLNALLKELEEPKEYNYFFLINNQTKKILDTIKSRCLDIKFLINQNQRNEIIDFLLRYYDQKIFFRKDIINITPGKFLLYNFICEENNINPSDYLLKNIKIVLSLYKKEKNYIYKDLLLFLTEYNLFEKKEKKLLSTQKFIELRDIYTKKIFDFFSYNLNQDTLLNSLKDVISE